MQQGNQATKTTMSRFFRRIIKPFKIRNWQSQLKHCIIAPYLEITIAFLVSFHSILSLEKLELLCKAGSFFI